MVVRRSMSDSDTQDGLTDWSQPPFNAGPSAQTPLPSDTSSNPAPPATTTGSVGPVSHTMTAPGHPYDHNNSPWTDDNTRRPTSENSTSLQPHLLTTPQSYGTEPPSFNHSEEQQRTPVSDVYTIQDHNTQLYQNASDTTPSRTPTHFRSNNPFIQAKRQRESLSKQNTGADEYPGTQNTGVATAQVGEKDSFIYESQGSNVFNDVSSPGNGGLHGDIHHSFPQNGPSAVTGQPPFGQKYGGHNAPFHPPVPSQNGTDGPWYSLGSATPQGNTANGAVDGMQPTSSSYESLSKDKSPSQPFDLLELNDALPPSHDSTQSHTERDTTTQKPDEPFSVDGAAVSTSKLEQPSLLDASPPQNANASASPSREMDTSKHSETYDIRQVNWTDGTTKLRRSPILVQNENGPCPLLALVNGLILRAKPGTQPPIVKALQTREQISLGLLIQALFDELISYPGWENQLSDIEALSSFLTMLHTGMNVNPKLVPVTAPWNLPGTFHETDDIRLYSSFNVPLVHGWLASPASPAHEALSRVAEYHDDIQLLHFQKEEMESRVLGGGALSPQDQQKMSDIDAIQHFVNVENPTQLSKFGLEHLVRSIDPGSISILFRNDHFSTLFKHPLSDQLFTLVTDAGYASHAEIVWESLVDVSGSKAEFFSGDFRPVGHTAAASQSHQEKQNVGSTSGGDSRAATTAAGSSANHSEQTDADYAYALSLQFQDEEEQRAHMNPSARGGRGGGGRRASSPPRTSWQQDGTTHRSSTGGGSSSSQRYSTSSTGRHSHHVRSLVPPRTHSAQDAENADAPPPTYEQAALSPAYIPEEGHPQHDHSPSIAGPRSSSYGFNNVSAHSTSNISPSPVRRPMVAQLPPRPRERRGEKDCIVM